MAFGFYIFILILIFTLVSAIVCMIAAFRISGWLKRTLLAAAALVLLSPTALMTIALKPELIDARIRTYKRFYGDIQVGMSRSEVLDALHRHYPTGGPRAEPIFVEDSTNRIGFFMNPENRKEPNCEGIFLTMQDGKVSRKVYSAD